MYREREREILVFSPAGTQARRRPRHAVGEAPFQENRPALGRTIKGGEIIYKYIYLSIYLSLSIYIYIYIYIFFFYAAHPQSISEGARAWQGG